MKKNGITIVLIFLLFTSISPVWGSGTRLETLGYLTNYYIIDSYNLWLFPSTIVDYNNKIFLESYTGNPLGEGGINLPVNPYVTIGIYLSDENRTIKYADPELAGNMANQRIDLFAGYRADRFNFGVHFATFQSKMEYSNPKDNKQNMNGELSSNTFEAGVSYIHDENSRLDATVSYTNRGFLYEDASRDTSKIREPYGHHSIGLATRFLYSLSEKVVLVPFFFFFYHGEGYEFLVDSLLITENKRSMLEKDKMMTFGIAFNLVPREMVLVTCATGMMRQTSTTETSLIKGTAPIAAENSYSVFPFVNIGMEADLLKWLGLRLSMYKLMEKLVQRTPVDANNLDEYNEYSNQYSASLGIYFRFGRLKIDTMLDTNNAANFLHNGPYLLSGRDYSATNFFTRVSVIYNFN